MPCVAHLSSGSSIIAGDRAARTICAKATNQNTRCNHSVTLSMQFLRVRRFKRCLVGVLILLAIYLTPHGQQRIDSQSALEDTTVKRTVVPELPTQQMQDVSGYMGPFQTFREPTYLHLPAASKTSQAVEAEKAACSNDFVLWPAPSAINQMSANRSKLAISANFTVFGLSGTVHEAVAPQLQSFRSAIASATAESASTTTKLGQLWIVPANKRRKLDAGVQAWSSDASHEAFSIIVGTAYNDAANVTVIVHSVQGLRYALQTLGSLVQPGYVATPPDNGTSAAATLPMLTLHDRPRFQFRGFVLDSAHHFVPLSRLKQLVVLLGRMRYNVLHWHATDTQAFQFVLPSHVELARESKGQYSAADIREVVKYAHVHGVTVIPELELPGHATAWVHSHPRLTSVGPQEHKASTSPSGQAYTGCPAGMFLYDKTRC